MASLKNNTLKEMMTQGTKEWVYVIPTVGGNVLTSLINAFVDNFLALLGLPPKDASQSQFEILSVKYKPFYSQCILASRDQIFCQVYTELSHLEVGLSRDILKSLNLYYVYC